MSAKRSKANRIQILPMPRRNRQRSTHQIAFSVITGNERLRGAGTSRNSHSGNSYLCAIEKNQSGKYDVRIRAVFGRDGWTLPVYFLASSFNVAMKRLEESLQLLQKNEERLRFWGLERTDDPNLAGDLLKELGLSLDRRKDLPRKVAEVEIGRERAVSSSVLASVRRVLADSLAQARPSHESAATGD
jgi:hypothetical protein